MHGWWTPRVPPYKSFAPPCAPPLEASWLRYWCWICDKDQLVRFCWRSTQMRASDASLYFRFVCPQDNSKSYLVILMKFYWWVGYATKPNQLDFGAYTCYGSTYTHYCPSMDFHEISMVGLVWDMDHLIRFGEDLRACLQVTPVYILDLLIRRITQNVFEWFGWNLVVGLVCNKGESSRFWCRSEHMRRIYQHIPTIVLQCIFLKLGAGRWICDKNISIRSWCLYACMWANHHCL